MTVLPELVAVSRVAWIVHKCPGLLHKECIHGALDRWENNLKADDTKVSPIQPVEL